MKKIVVGITGASGTALGEAESDLSPHTLTSLNNIYEQAAANNITVVAASGDQGANDGTSNLEVNFPASDPSVLGVGGTTLNQISSGQYTQTACCSIYLFIYFLSHVCGE